jgi:hypothetical protein
MAGGVVVQARLDRSRPSRTREGGSPRRATGSGPPVRPGAGAGARQAFGPISPAHVHALQRTAGNAAVATLLRDDRDNRESVVQRCGPDHPDCGCSDAERLEALEAPTVQRDDLLGSFGPPPGSPFGLPGPGGGPKADRLDFTDRSFMDQSLPTVCPRCHRDAPTVPLAPRYVDREATEPRLVSWGAESEKALQTSWTVRELQLVPDAVDRIVDDFGVGLTKRITSSHEFQGSDRARAGGADTIRRRWGDIRPTVKDKTSGWYQNELLTAVGMTPKDASPVLAPAVLRSVLTTHHGGTVALGRWGATAKPGQPVDRFVIHDTDGYTVWLYIKDRPLWIYSISGTAFIRSHDPFVGDVVRQVADNTAWIKHLMPFLLKVAAFGLGFSGSVAFIITGIVLDELATEMQADADGRPGRSPQEILGSAGTQFLVDRLFHGLFGGGGKAAAASGVGRSAAKAERIAERAAPIVRRELVEAERPLVKNALDAGTARKVSEGVATKEGHTLEVAIESGGQRHVYKLGRNGKWCRHSSPICELDLGPEIATAAKSPRSVTATKLDDVRSQMKAIEDEHAFLQTVYRRMQPGRKVDVSLLSKEERAFLDDLAQGGDAAKVTMRELRDMAASPRFARELKAAEDLERKLVDQLYREGRPLYEIMRAASPSYKSRAAVIREAGSRDAVTGLAARTGALDVDHVVPLNDIVRMPGFDKLRPDRQLEIVNDVKNLRAVDALANRSRGDRSWHGWSQALVYYEYAAIARMRTLEDELRTYLAGRIAALSRL